MSTARAITRSIPYAGPSPMPRATAEERFEYEHAAAIAALELVSYEPHEAMLERARWRNWRDYEDMVEFVRDFAAHWRSLPDYDGPPMRAPSGVEWRFDVPGEPLAVPIGVVIRASSERWAMHIRGVAYSTTPDDGRKDEHGVVRFASWYMENFGGTRLITDCFDPPSKGGRGWCPKLAGVVT